MTQGRKKEEEIAFSFCRENKIFFLSGNA